MKKAVIEIPAYMIYIVPIIAIAALYLIFGRIEGFVSESLMLYGGPPLQGLENSGHYVFLIWVLLIPLFVGMYPIIYFIIERNLRVTINLVVQEIGLFFLAGVLEDWAVFAFSPKLSLKDPGSVFVNAWGMPTFNFLGNPVPIVYPIFLAVAVVLNIFALRDYIPGVSSFKLEFTDVNELVIALEQRSKQLKMKPAQCQNCGATFAEEKMKYPSTCPTCGEKVRPPQFTIV